MTIQRAKFPNRFLILPNSKYVFTSSVDGQDFSKIPWIFEWGETAQISISLFGTLGFTFHDDGPLASIEVSKFKGQGSIPEEVMKSEDEINILQEKRILFANFIAAALSGRIFAKLHRSLDGALYNGQDKIVGFDIVQDFVRIEQTGSFIIAKNEKLKFLQGTGRKSYFLDKTIIDDAVKYIQSLQERAESFEYADLPTCMVMNYQAAILHNQQHAAASLALNFSIIESLIKEIYYAYGFIKGYEPKPFVTKTYEIEKISKKEFENMKFHKALKILNEAKFLDPYVYSRIEDKRLKRNNLMHKGEAVISKDSGDAQTLVRDLWAFLIEAPFELNAGWSYRR